ncbi:MAG: hypothetical protein JNM88_04830 [Chitinophagaceae bacterium]|nr:hypothetical protein [Chitinophagaceae bacterium]
METNQPTSQPVYAPASAAPGMFGTKVPSAVAFAAGILLFLMPFADIRCGGFKVAQKSGLDFALNNEWKIATGGFGGDTKTDKALSAGKEEKGNTQYYIIGALGLGVLGLMLTFAGAKAGGGGVVTGVLAAGALIAFMIELKKNFANSLRQQAIEKATEKTNDFGFNSLDDAKAVLTITPWLYVAIVAFLAAAFFCYKRMSAPK